MKEAKKALESSVVATKSLFRLSQLIKSLTIRVTTNVVIITEPIQNVTIRMRP